MDLTMNLWHCLLIYGLMTALRVESASSLRGRTHYLSLPEKADSYRVSSNLNRFSSPPPPYHPREVLSKSGQSGSPLRVRSRSQPKPGARITRPVPGPREPIISMDRNQCHVQGPSSFCPCKNDHSYVLRSPKKGSFQKRKRLLILDIDETILSAVQPMTGYSLWINNQSDTRLISFGSLDSEPIIHGVWQYGFELFFISKLNIAAVVRPDFFQILDEFVHRDFNVILYTRGCKEYGEMVHLALSGLYLKWKELHKGINITTQSIKEAYRLFDMVIASQGAGKTLELVHDFIDLESYEAVWILDDAAHEVWCMDFIQWMRSSPKFLLIKPEAFAPWHTIKPPQFRTIDKEMYAARIRRILEKDVFFKSLLKFLKFYVLEGVSQSEERYRSVLAGYTLGKDWYRMQSPVCSWWKWDPMPLREKHGQSDEPRLKPRKSSGSLKQEMSRTI